MLNNWKYSYTNVFIIMYIFPKRNIYKYKFKSYIYTWLLYIYAKVKFYMIHFLKIKNMYISTFYWNTLSIIALFLYCLIFLSKKINRLRDVASVLFFFSFRLCILIYIVAWYFRRVLLKICTYACELPEMFHNNLLYTPNSLCN